MEHQYNVLVTYGSAGYFAAKKEVQAILTKLGDQKAQIDLIAPGSIGILTKIPAKKLVEDLRELYLSDPEVLSTTGDWIPLEYWCASTVPAVVKVIRDE